MLGVEPRNRFECGVIGINVHFSCVLGLDAKQERIGLGPFMLKGIRFFPRNCFGDARDSPRIRATATTAYFKPPDSRKDKTAASGVVPWAPPRVQDVGRH